MGPARPSLAAAALALIALTGALGSEACGVLHCRPATASTPACHDDGAAPPPASGHDAGAACCLSPPAETTPGVPGGDVIRVALLPAPVPLPLAARTATPRPRTAAETTGPPPAERFPLRL